MLADRLRVARLTFNVAGRLRSSSAGTPANEPQARLQPPRYPLLMPRRGSRVPAATPSCPRQAPHSPRGRFAFNRLMAADPRWHVSHSDCLTFFNTLFYPLLPACTCDASRLVVAQRASVQQVFHWRALALSPSPVSAAGSSQPEAERAAFVGEESEWCSACIAVSQSQSVCRQTRRGFCVQLYSIIYAVFGKAKPQLPGSAQKSLSEQ